MRGRELVGWNIRRLRVARGISQERLAYDTGIDRSYLGGVERGGENPTVDVLDRIAAVLKCPLAELFREPEIGSERPAPLRPGRRPG